MLYKSHLLLLELWDMVDGYCFMGPSGRFYPCCYPWDYIGLFGTSKCRFCNWVELPVQRRLCGLTGSQRTPGFWGVTAWYQSLGIRIPRELGFGYPSPLGWFGMECRCGSLEMEAWA